ncbi:MAG: glycoside hydrolase family 31 protein [Lachnospiraceae bacterium]|nr:glycoside hydrolase family 31 protein [Lachnospiraceae bacterium]
MNFGKRQAMEQQGNRLTLHFEKQDVILTILKDDIIRVLVPYWMKDYKSKAIEGEKAVSTEYTVEETADAVIVKTDRLSLHIYDDFYMEAYDDDGHLLMSDYRGDRLKKAELDKQAAELLEAEGHDASKLEGGSYAVQTLKTLAPEDCFYGLGDKSGFMNKRHYEYENWNSDLPQAHTEDFHALYKSIPFLICLRRDCVYGLFFDNTFHSYINLGKESDEYFYYGADDGNLDYYILGGRTMADVIGNYTYLTGRTPLPQLWTLGYQQSRWGYTSAKDIMEVAGKYRELQIPCDVIHLDIDYMDHFKVFTWDEENYEKKGQLFDRMRELGYKPVTIIDPGTKKEDGYFMYEEGVARDYFAKDPEGNIYVNVVWPGDSVYPDFGRKEVRDWWADHHKELLDMGVQGIWDDMNEPASFRGELPLDVEFHDEERAATHGEIHNVYGHNMSRATFAGLQKHTGKRPFVITRACYAGSQKYATVWTGDNQSLWSHLQMLVPQLCNLGMSGFAFCGTDVGGFGADCTPELLCRWVEAACFSPLFRNHSCQGSRRQEPWQFGENVAAINRKYIELRYRFLPYIYDLFYQGQKSGLPVMRPLVLHYADDPEVRNLNGEFLVGEQILVAPVLEQGVTRKMVYLPEGVWYDYWTGERLEGRQYLLREAPLDVCPIYIKAGSIIPTYDVCQYVGEKEYKTLHLLSTPGEAEYVHFQDNGTDYAYEEGHYNLYQFTRKKDGTVQTKMLHEDYPKYQAVLVETLGE